MKIAVCGPREFGSCQETEDVRIIYTGLANLVTDGTILATGGTAGFPERVLEGVKRTRKKVFAEAYTPCADNKEWDDYFAKGIASQRDLFDRIIFSQEGGDFKLRALRRIPHLVHGSDVILAYLNQHAKNTYIELLTAQSFGIPTLVLYHEAEIMQKTLMNSGIHVSSPEELVEKLNEFIENR